MTSLGTLKKILPLMSIEPENLPQRHDDRGPQSFIVCFSEDLTGQSELCERDFGA
jgi:hypothetical protein